MHKLSILLTCLIILTAMPAHADLFIDPFPNKTEDDATSGQALSQEEPVIEDIEYSSQDEMTPLPKEMPAVVPEPKPAKKAMAVKETPKSQEAVRPPTRLTSFDIEKYYALFDDVQNSAHPEQDSYQQPILQEQAVSNEQLRIAELEERLRAYERLETKTRDLEQDNQILKSELLAMKAQAHTQQHKEVEATPAKPTTETPKQMEVSKTVSKPASQTLSADAAVGSVASYYARFAPSTHNVTDPVMTPAPLQASTENSQTTSLEPASGQSQQAETLSRPVQRQVLESKSWKASKGHSVKRTLSAWANQEGIEFFWVLDGDFSVLGNVNSQMSFESAVESLLKQFETETKRPVGSLHIDPRNGNRVLVIESLG